MSGAPSTTEVLQLKGRFPSWVPAFLLQLFEQVHSRVNMLPPAYSPADLARGAPVTTDAGKGVIILLVVNAGLRSDPGCHPPAVNHGMRLHENIGIDRFGHIIAR
jgi:hypothetical protein